MILLPLLAMLVVTTILVIGKDVGWFPGPMDTSHHTYNSYDESKAPVEPDVVAPIIILWLKRVLLTLLSVALAEFVVVSGSIALIELDVIVSMFVVEFIVVVVCTVHVGLDDVVLWLCSG